MTKQSCPHGHYREYWEEDKDDPDPSSGRWVKEWVSSTVDIDTFRYQCTTCKEIMFYSGGGKQLFEEGGHECLRVYGSQNNSSKTRRTS